MSTPNYGAFWTEDAGEILEDETSVRAAFEARAGAQTSASPVQQGALASAPKRVVVSWDQRKLGGRY